MNVILTFLRRNTPRVISLSLVLFVSLNLCGCLSMAAVDKARSRRFVDENGEVISTEKGSLFRRQHNSYWLISLFVSI